MSATYFIQSCPTCGRTLQVRVEYLGRSLVCQHCRGAFVAAHPDSLPPPSSDSSDALLERVDELLGSTSEDPVTARWRVQ